MCIEKIDSFSGQFAWLSNFWAAKVNYEGIVYPSAENAFQAAKCLDPTQRLKFKSIGPSAAKKLGRVIELRRDWGKVKLAVMEDIVREKFLNIELGNKLLSTGDSIIEEGNWWHDSFWGIALPAKIGHNHLGKILMKIRKELKENMNNEQ